MKSFAMIVTTIIISACSSTNNNDSSPLQGVWLTEACEQAPAEMGPSEGEWGKGIYEFTQENTIKRSWQFYFGSTCTVETMIFEPANSGESLSYSDLGPVTLQEGIEGNELSLIFTNGTPITSFDGFYTLNNGKLCFSDGFSFSPFSISIDGSATTTNNINFEQCFVKKQP